MINRFKKSFLGKGIKWLLRAFLSWRFYFKQLYWSYKYYRTKKLANNCDIKCKINYVGKRNTKFPHPLGIVIGIGVKMGNNCIIFQNVTLGAKNFEFGDNYPNIGSNVVIGANSVLIGNIKIGNNVVIGACTLVNKDIPDNTIVAGNPMRIIGLKNSNDK